MQMSGFSAKRDLNSFLIRKGKYKFSLFLFLLICSSLFAVYTNLYPSNKLQTEKISLIKNELNQSEVESKYTDYTIKSLEKYESIDKTLSFITKSDWYVSEYVGSKDFKLASFTSKPVGEFGWRDLQPNDLAFSIEINTNTPNTYDTGVGSSTSITKSRLESRINIARYRN